MNQIVFLLLATLVVFQLQGTTNAAPNGPSKLEEVKEALRDAVKTKAGEAAAKFEEVKESLKDAIQAKAAEAGVDLEDVKKAIKDAVQAKGAEVAAFIEGAKEKAEAASEFFINTAAVVKVATETELSKGSATAESVASAIKNALAEEFADVEINPAVADNLKEGIQSAKNVLSKVTSAVLDLADDVTVDKEEVLALLEQGLDSVAKRH